jgi:hypothetical protein
MPTNVNGSASFSFVPARAGTGAGGTSEFSRARIVVRPAAG